MSDVKRRKLNGPVASSAPMSAIAARRAKAQAASKAVDTTIAEDVIPLVSAQILTLSKQVGKKGTNNLEVTSDEALAESTNPNVEAASTPLRLEDEGPSLTYESRAVSTELSLPRPSIIFSTLKPSKDNIKGLVDGGLLLTLQPGERLVILGQFEITIKKGQVTLLGSTLQPSKSSYRVFAPSSHSLPVIRCTSSEINNAEIRIRQCHTGLESLKTLSALFGSLWNDGSGSLGWEHSSLLKYKGRSSFKILLTSQDGPPKSFLQPLISPPEWNETLSQISENTTQQTPSILLCGPKSSGKSTFAKILGNRLLSTAQGSKGIVILDLDPGQPEYSPPGFLSLVHLKTPNFGPSFSHPTTTGTCKTIRSHAIGAITPSLDPSLYMACALDLFRYYRSFLQLTPKCPLIINTPGWVFGTGLEILVELITKVNPTELIYMSLDGPSEVVDTLREASRSTPLLTLPSQGSEYATRTAAQLRTMLNMSYFHLSSQKEKAQEISWSDTPLSSIPPWQVGYIGERAGILGVICYGEQPPANLLTETINGSLIAVVAIDDMVALPFSDQNIDVTEQSTELQDADLHILEPSTFHPTHLEKQMLVSTPEGLPYFNPLNSISLDPNNSHALGLALVRGVDVERNCLQLLTPISRQVIESVVEEGKKIVLVSGKLDTPGWAYTEAFSQADFRAKELKHKEQRTSQADAEVASSEDDESEDEFLSGTDQERSFHNAPWVQRLHGSQGRGVGSRVWRVRRDLGRSEGGD